MKKVKMINFSCYPEIMDAVERATWKTNTRTKGRYSKSAYIRKAVLERLKKDKIKVIEKD